MQYDGSNRQCGQWLESHLCYFTFTSFVRSSVSSNLLHELLQLDDCVRNLLRSCVDGISATSHIYIN